VNAAAGSVVVPQGASCEVQSKPASPVNAHASPRRDLTSGKGTVIDYATASRHRVAGRTQTCPADPSAGEYVGVRNTVPAGPSPPAWWVGRSLAGRPRAVTPGERPEDAPTRGDHHPARIRARQGPQMHLLAETRRRSSVHPTDLRPTLPGMPHPRPAVLQPWRPAVPGARHRSAGGGAGPAVAGQENDAGRHRPARSGPWRRRLGPAAAGSR
jgi:hypothetical protein